MKKLTIEEMQNLAHEHGGKCLSESYVDNKTKLLWECEKGHQWEAIPSSIKRGVWCPECGGCKRLNIEDMHQIAKEREGKCFSNFYKNAHAKLRWECSEEHQWEATPDKVINNGTWCPHCAGNARRNLAEMQAIAISRGGECLSREYLGINTKLLWECAEGHQWEAIPTSVVRGSWCSVCYETRRGDSLRLTIEDMKQVARERGGRCLSRSYGNVGVKLLWECAFGHQWRAPARDVRSGRWCPTCSSGLGERICRVAFEQIFNMPFPKSYPRWLINDRENQMELDGYCENLNIAFEHQGIQHYKESEFFYKNSQQFKQRQIDDKLKKSLCEENGVHLIEVPELFSLLMVGDLVEYLVGEFKSRGIVLPDGLDINAINFTEAYRTSGAKEALAELKLLAKSKGGKLLSKHYVNNSTKLLWECEKGHQWETTPNKIKQNRWCHECAGNKSLTLSEAKELAKMQGGKCLSESYTNSLTRLLWECSEGHQWKASLNNVKRGTWCPKCSAVEGGKSRRGTIEEMILIAKARGGKCLSEVYVNSKTKLLWECERGHQWESTPNDVSHGSWCHECGGSKKGTIEDMHELAISRKGKCLSGEYINAKVALLWECSEGHQWSATPDTVKNQESWCPICARNKN